MAYEPHDVIKPSANAEAMATLLGENLVISNTFSRFSAEEYLGKAGDKITKRVTGTLPFRRWGFRNDRREPLRVDSLTETTVDMTVSAEWLTSAVEMTPEQKQFDFNGAWGDLFLKQTDALTRGVEFDAMHQIVNAPYELVQNIDVSPEAIAAQAAIGRDYLFNQFLNLRTALRRMRTPGAESLTIVAGSNFVAELQKSGKLIDAQVKGTNAFGTVEIGSYAGMKVIEGPYTMDPNEAYAYVSDAFLFWNAAPPAADGSIKQGNANVNGLSLQWFQDYDPAYVVNRSVYLAWQSWDITKDFLSLEAETGQLFTSPDRYFVRGVKLLLTADDPKKQLQVFGGSAIPTAADVAAELRHPGSGKGDTPGAEKDSFLAKAYRGEIADGKIDEGLFMPLHLRKGATTQNPTPTESKANVGSKPQTRNVFKDEAAKPASKVTKPSDSE